MEMNFCWAQRTNGLPSSPGGLCDVGVGVGDIVPILQILVIRGQGWGWVPSLPQLCLNFHSLSCLC